jgi:NADP-dependent 3-hydroxy acid dehydrogenase YdfG
MEALTDTLRAELFRYRVAVSSIQPGACLSGLAWPACEQQQQSVC